METDYPAAHSMDTEWFAVDAEGFLAIMSSGEDGPLPTDFENFRAYNNSYDGEFLIDDLEKHLGKTVERDRRFDYPKPASLGLFHYSHDLYREDMPEEGTPHWNSMPPYERVAIPEQPLNISQLPADIANKMRVIRFERAKFHESKNLQPIGTLACKSIIWADLDGFNYYLDENMQPHEMTDAVVVSVKQFKVGAPPKGHT